MPVGANLVRANAAIRALLQQEVRLSTDAACFWDLLLGTDPLVRVPSGQLFASRGWVQTTVVTQLGRSGLPTTSACRVAILSVYAASLFDGADDRIDSVAYRLGFASQQSFSRHVQRYAKMTPTSFRNTVPVPMALEWMRDRILRPHREEWSRFGYATEEAKRRQRGAPALPAVTFTKCAHCGASTRTVMA